MSAEQPPAPTPNVSETPRTDAKKYRISRKGLPTNAIGYTESEIVPADFARQLERELAAVTKERDEWKRLYGLSDERADNMESERDHAEANMDAALARAEKAEEDTRRLDWLMEKIQWHTPLTMYGEVREYRFRTPITTPTINIRKAIDAALTPTKEPAP